MSEQPLGQIPLVDQGNGLLEHVPARMDTGTVELPDGQGKLGVLTIRTQSTTLTVMLGAQDLREWGGIIAGLADQLNGLVKASLMDVAAMDMDPGLNLGLPARRGRKGL